MDKSNAIGVTLGLLAKIFCDSFLHHGDGGKLLACEDWSRLLLFFLMRNSKFGLSSQILVVPKIPVVPSAPAVPAVLGSFMLCNMD